MIRVDDLKKGTEVGYCRICGKYTKLTSEHIPPKSSGNKQKVSVEINGKSFRFQNGFNCRTICDDCNNNLLGANYDKEFKILYDRVKKFELSKIEVPNNLLVIDIDVNKLVKCMFGHFLAANVIINDTPIKEILEKPINNIKFFENYRKYILGEEKLENIDVYYWYYPYRTIKIMPYFGYNHNLISPYSPTVLGTLIKIYPIALWVDVTKQKNYKLQIPKIDFKQNKVAFNVLLADKYFPDHVRSEWGIVIDTPSSIEVKR